MNKWIKSLTLSLMFIFFTQCGGGSGPVTKQTTPELSTSQMAFTFSDTSALLLSDSSATYETELGNVTTNLSKILDDGTLAPAFSASSSDSLSSVTIKIDYFALSPVEDIHIMFKDSLLVGSERCRWIVIKTDNQISCITSELSFDYFPENMAFSQASTASSPGFSNNVTQLRFDTSGNAFYTVELENKIMKWNREENTLSTVIDGDSIDFEPYTFLVAPDESLIISGYLEGIGSRKLFRYIPSLNELQIPCDDGDFFLSKSGILYVYGECTIDDGTIAEGVLKGTFTDGTLAFLKMEEGDADVDLGGDFYEDSSGNIYTYDDGDSVTWLNEGAFEEIKIDGINDVELSKVKGDYFYETGTDSLGNRVFIRKYLLGDREEADLLGGANLLVQQFDVTDEGDVYFGALDLTTTQVYLYKYNNSIGELEAIDSLDSDLSQIITL